jgi:hypothetical protein
MQSLEKKEIMGLKGGKKNIFSLVEMPENAGLPQLQEE